MHVNINKKSPQKGLASSLRAESSFEVFRTDLVLDSSTDHMLIDQFGLKIIKN